MLKKQLSVIAFAFLAALVILSPSAFAQFDVNWGTSTDNGNAGYTDLGTWFKNNGYAADQAAGESFAKTGYIGFGSGDTDPFTWNAAPSVTFQVVQRLAGNADLTKIGYYTGTGAGKSLTNVLGLNQNGPQTVSINNPFGLYINTPNAYRGTTYVNWFTDRAENSTNQINAPFNVGGDPQALIYNLNNTEWLIAWEDLDLTRKSTDRDFNDAYLKVTVTPEPISVALFSLGVGVLGLAGIRRRKKSL